MCAAMATKMENDLALKVLPFCDEVVSAAIAAASDLVIDSDCPYDPCDPHAVTAFWSQAKVRLPG